MESKNLIGRYLMARHMSTDAGYDSKILALKRITEKYPFFGWAFNDLGMIYGGKKKNH